MRDASTMGKAKGREGLVQFGVLGKETVPVSKGEEGSMPAFPPAEHVGSKKFRSMTESSTFRKFVLYSIPFSNSVSVKKTKF